MTARTALSSSTANTAFSQRATATTNVLGFAGTPTRVLINQPSHDWHPQVLARLNELTRLEPGWDGYRAPPVSFENANFALRMLEATCQNTAPAPQIAPGSCGDLQIEWHTRTGDIELHVRAPNDVHAWRYLSSEAIDEDQYLSNDFATVVDWISRLVEPASAIRTATAR